MAQGGNPQAFDCAPRDLPSRLTACAGIARLRPDCGVPRDCGPRLQAGGSTQFSCLGPGKPFRQGRNNPSPGIDPGVASAPRTGPRQGSNKRLPTRRAELMLLLFPVVVHTGAEGHPRPRAAGICLDRAPTKKAGAPPACHCEIPLFSGRKTKPST